MYPAQKEVALIEIYDSHDETLYSQLLFLKQGGYDTTLICSEKLRTRIKDYNTGHTTRFVNCSNKKGWDLISEILKIRRIILNEKIELVIFNTAHGNIIRNLCMLSFPKRIQFAGTLHGVNKLQGSLAQKIISRRVKKYFLLSDYMLQKTKKVPSGNLQFAVYYPMFYPDFPKVTISAKKPGTLWIAIPGAVEYKRRDYTTLLNVFSKLQQKPDVQFILLGNGHHKEGNGTEIQQIVKDLGLEAYFIFFNEFVNNDVFHQYLKASDAILPLIHPINTDMEKYLENQISGSFNLAFGYKKPLLMHEYFSRYPSDFEDNSIFYNLENMDKMLTLLPQSLQDHSSFYTNVKWDFEYQAANYLTFLR